MKKFYILCSIILCFFNSSFAGEKDSTINVYFIKGNVGKLIPFSNSNPSVIKSDYNTFSISVGYINFKEKEKMNSGLEFEYLNSKLVNTDNTLGANLEYKLSGVFVKSISYYKVSRRFRIQSNIGIGSITCTRPNFEIPANISSNGKLINEYSTETSNNCFTFGLGISYSIFKFVAITANCDYLGATFNFKNVVHSEDKFITSVYNPDFKLRAYYVSLGIIIHN